MQYEWYLELPERSRWDAGVALLVHHERPGGSYVAVIFSGWRDVSLWIGRRQLMLGLPRRRRTPAQQTRQLEELLAAMVQKAETHAPARV